MRIITKLKLPDGTTATAHLDVSAEDEAAIVERFGGGDGGGYGIACHAATVAGLHALVTGVAAGTVQVLRRVPRAVPEPPDEE